MKDILVHILKGFYNMTDLTAEEKKLYRNPINFERLITSPWIRIVKNLELEEKGKFEYEQNKKKINSDPSFSNIIDSEVREIIQQISNVFKIPVKTNPPTKL